MKTYINTFILLYKHFSIYYIYNNILIFAYNGNFHNKRDIMDA